jgi:hypothetical protein
MSFIRFLPRHFKEFISAVYCFKKKMMLLLQQRFYPNECKNARAARIGTQDMTAKEKWTTNSPQMTVITTTTKADSEERRKQPQKVIVIIH